MAFKMKSSENFKEPKKTPVFLLLDVSGSMYGEKIDMLNDAVDTLLQTLAADEAPYLVSVITFGSRVDCYIEPTSAKEASDRWRNMDADGMTPMGGALRMAKDIIEDNTVIKGRMYYPVVVLVSDGAPNDEWKPALEAFIGTGRTAKCQRMAMGIGADANMSVLKKFVQGMTDDAIYKAADADEIPEFFKKVTRVSQEQARGRSSLAQPSAASAKQAPAGGSGPDLHGDLPPTDVDDDDDYY